MCVWTQVELDFLEETNKDNLIVWRRRALILNHEELIKVEQEKKATKAQELVDKQTKKRVVNGDGNERAPKRQYKRKVTNINGEQNTSTDIIVIQEPIVTNEITDSTEFFSKF